MISIEKMKKAEGKRVKIIGTNGKSFELKCLSFHYPEDEEEEPMLEFKNYLFNQSEIESIEIMNIECN